MARKDKEGVVAKVLEEIIQRPDEIVKFMNFYWSEGKEKLSSQVKKGLAKSFSKFSEYQLSKWNRKGNITLRDIMFLCHPKPENKDREELYFKLANNKLEIPDTWEVNLSSGKDKKETWERLLLENKLGALALLKNLRNIREAQVPNEFVINALNKMNVERILPFRFITAEKYAKNLTVHLEDAMFRCIDKMDKLDGKTILLVDVSGSMDDTISSKGEYNRIDAACGIAILLRELCDDIDIYTFSNNLVKVKQGRGFNLAADINCSQSHASTNLYKSLSNIFAKNDRNARYIVITDEQATDTDRVDTISPNSYVINVSSYKNEIDYGNWKKIYGFSENVITWIHEYEKEDKNNWITNVDDIFMSVFNIIGDKFSSVRI
jgi:hypothetical protein